jgi:biotin synthase-like enzyme
MSEILELTQVELREKEEELEAKVMGWMAKHAKELQAMSREESDKKLKEAQERLRKEVFPNEVRIKA